MQIAVAGHVASTPTHVVDANFASIATLRRCVGTTALAEEAIFPAGKCESRPSFSTEEEEGEGEKRGQGKETIKILSL